jgi:hypothetical protein
MEIVPLTDQTWNALAELFREGGDPRSCWCQSQVGDCPYSFSDVL